MRKKYYVCLIVLLFSCSSFAFGNPKKVNELIKINASGNTQGNIINNGLVSESKKWIYGTIDSFDLSRMSLDGKKIERLTNGHSIDCVNVVGNYIFYRDMKYDLYSMARKNISHIYRMDIKSKKSTRVSNDSMEYYYIYKGRIYFSNIKLNDTKKSKYLYQIFQMNLDGSSKKIIYSKNVETMGYNEEFAVSNNYIYFINLDIPSEICKYDMKSKKECTILKRIPNIKNYIILDFIVDDNTIYFDVRIKRSDGVDGFTDNIYSMNKNGENLKLFIKNTASWFNTDKDWLYYTQDKKNDIKNEIYKIKKDGSGKIKISDIDARNLNLINNWIICNGGYDDVNLYKIKTDGSGKYDQIRY